jgi:hypothetical protein
MIGYGDQILDFVEKSVFGQYAEESPDVNTTKDLFRKEFSRKVLPMLPWEVIDEILEKVKLDVVKGNVEKATEKPAGDDMSGGEEY